MQTHISMILIMMDIQIILIFYLNYILLATMIMMDALTMLTYSLQMRMNVLILIMMETEIMLILMMIMMDGLIPMKED